MVTRQEVIEELVPKLVKQFQEVLRQEGESGITTLFEGFLELMPNSGLQGIILAFSLTEMVEKDLDEQVRRVRRAIPCITTENLEEEEMPASVRDYLIVGHCDLGCIIAPREDSSLYLVLPEKKDANSEMIIRDYQIDTPDGLKFFVEYYSHQTSAFDNGWSEDGEEKDADEV